MSRPCSFLFSFSDFSGLFAVFSVLCKGEVIQMTKRKMLTVLLALLMVLSLAGFHADSEKPDSGTAADSRIAETITESHPETIVESSFPVDTESKTEITAEKEKVESSAPAENGGTAEAPKPAENTQKADTAPQEQTPPPKQTEAPRGTEPQSAAPAEQPTEPTAPAPTADEIARKTAEKLNALRQAQGSPAATVLPGLGRVAALRARQLITNFSHESDPDACTVLKYGEYVDMTDCGMPEASYYRGYNAEAAAKGNWTGTADEIAEKIANGFKSSAGHWRYVGSSEYAYMAVGIAQNGSYWYCCVCVSSKNYGG